MNNQTFPQSILNALKLVKADQRYSQSFESMVLKDPYLLNDYRLSDYITDIGPKTDQEIADLIKLLYPTRDKTEWLNVYPDDIDTNNKTPQQIAQELKPVGIANLRHSYPRKETEAELVDFMAHLKAKTRKYLYPQVCVQVFLLSQDENGKVYLTLSCRATEKCFGTLDSVFGGRVDVGEDIMTAGIREIQEEAGLEAVQIQLIHYQRYHDKFEGNDHDLIGVCLLGLSQIQQILDYQKSLGTPVYRAENLSEFQKYLPSRLGDLQQMKKGPELIHNEVLYVLKAPLTDVLSYYQGIKSSHPEQEALQILKKDFAWISDKDGNYLGNSVIIDKLKKFLKLV